jgi:hypothetical protein
MVPSVAAFTWQREQLSRAWHVAHVAIDRAASEPCAVMKSGEACDDGFGNFAMVLSLSAVACASGT